MRRFVFFLGSAVITIVPVKTDAGWSRYLEGNGSCVRQASDGGYIIAGSIKPGDTLKSYLVKTDELGNPLWTKTFGNGRLNWVEQTKDGGYITAGLSDLIKLDKDGNVIWRNNYDTVTYDSINFYGSIRCVQQTSDDGYIAAGCLSHNGVYEPYYCVWFLKITSGGDSLWAMAYELDLYSKAYQIAETHDGYIALARVSGFPSIGGPTMLLKMNAVGDTVWSSDFEREPLSMALTTDEKILISGVCPVQNNGSDMWLCCTDSLGNILWEKTYGTQGYDDGWSISTTDGGFIITGEKDGDNSGFKGDVWLLKIDTSGDTLWTKTYDTDTTDLGLDARQTADGGYIILATSSAFPSDKGIWLIKTDSIGSIGISELSVSRLLSHDFEIVSAIGPTVTLRYSNCPNGFHASVYDAGGRRVDEIKSAATSGIIRWGGGREPGCYFIVTQGGNTRPAKVVIVR